MSSGNKCIIEGKPKASKAGPRVRRASHPSGVIRPLAFVNVSNPGQVKDQATQRKIRRHVMTAIGQSRRKYSIRPVEQRQDLSAVTASQRIPEYALIPIPSYWGDVKICTNFKRLFRAMDMVSKGLLSIAVDDTMRKSGEGAFNDLCNVQSGSGQYQIRYMYEMEQYTDSLGMVRKSIQATESSASRHAVIGTVICLAYFDMRACNHEGWTLHMQGLENIVGLYGGIEALESQQALRQSLFLTDVLGSLIYDTEPRFSQLRYPSMPAHVATGTCGVNIPNSPGILGIASLPNDMSSMVIESALQSALQLAVLLNYMPRHSAHQMALDLLIPVCKIAHDILSLPRLYYDSLGSENSRRCTIPQTTRISTAAELVRVSALALVSTVITTTSGDDLYCAVYRRGLVRDLLVHTKPEAWGILKQLRLWVLVVQVMMETGPARMWLLDEIMDAMDSSSLRSWNDLTLWLHQIAWIEDAATQEMAHLKSDVEGRLAQRAVT